MLLQSKISPSMMCADRMHLGETLKTFEESGIEYLHLDIMDGAFVPNFAMGTDECLCLRNNCTIPADYHLMVEKPEQKIDWFPIQTGDIVSVHVESTVHLQRILSQIKGKGAKAFVALNPATPLTVLEYVAQDLDGVLVMTVNPGFAGQKAVAQAFGKITAVRTWLDSVGRQDAMIEVDGNVSFENAVKMRRAGADIFVAGTSSIFSPARPLTESIASMRSALV